MTETITPCVAAIGGIYRAQEPAMRARLADAYRRVTAEAADGDGMLRVPHSAVVASGRPG